MERNDPVREGCDGEKVTLFWRTLTLALALKSLFVLSSDISLSLGFNFSLMLDAGLLMRCIRWNTPQKMVRRLMPHLAELLCLIFGL